MSILLRFALARALALYGSAMHLAGNILVKKGASGDHELVPIDHGYVLPDSFQDISFEWLYWPQARAPLGEHIGTCNNHIQNAIVLTA